MAVKATPSDIQTTITLALLRYKVSLKSIAFQSENRIFFYAKET